MVAVINSVLGGVFAGLLSRFLFALPIYVDFGLGVAFFVVGVFAQRHYIVRKFADLEGVVAQIADGRGRW